MTFKRFEFWRVAGFYSHRSRKEPWGRFGGGWNWKLGIQVGSTTVIFSLLVAQFGFTWLSNDPTSNGPKTKKALQFARDHMGEGL